MSDEFDGLDATEKAGIGAALNRRRALAAQIVSELRNKRHEP
jgi:tRNA-dihydrouridine synthase